MSKNINCEFVGMKKNKGKSNGFKSLQQEVKRKQKAEEIVKAIQKIQNEPKQKKEPQLKTKHFKTYANSVRNIQTELECYEQATIDAIDERDFERMEEAFEAIKNNDYSDYHEQWSNIQINLNRDVEEDEEQQREREFDLDQSTAKDWSDDYYPEFPVQDIEDKYSDLDEYERRNETNEAIYDYVCGNSTDDSYTEEFEPTVPRHLEFESRIYDLEQKLSASQETIFQLLGGLFNKETQTQTLESHIKFLYTGRTLTDEEIQENRLPTTRQGDENAERIEQLEKNNALLKENLEATQLTLHQLIGGLYNQRTQKKMLSKHTVCLFSLNQDDDDEDFEENKWPTTRQGDENEERIKKLEENIDVLVKKLKKGKPLHRFYRKFQKK
jgi:uncharacterized coiled-coil protein SlyX